MTEGIQGRVAIVTGAGGGIGRALAQGLARAGASVVLADKRADAGAALAETINGDGGRALARACDVTSRESVEAMVAETVAQFGPPRILVNNAGTTSTHSFLTLPEEEWDRVLGVNLKGPFLCGQAVARHMAEAGGGAIINVTSQLGEVALRNKAHYVSAKGGLKMLTKAMALELAPLGIRVNALAPGPIETELTAPLLADLAVRSALLERIPLGRFGQPEDLVASLLFLAGEGSRFVTGTTLFVDGGYLAG
jgi:NAD(P)-dependent dehydrogenase (short-subunit alcohol dehydrogenase family)